MVPARGPLRDNEHIAFADSDRGVSRACFEDSPVNAVFFMNINFIEPNRAVLLHVELKSAGTLTLEYAAVSRTGRLWPCYEDFQEGFYRVGVVYQIAIVGDNEQFCVGGDRR